MTSFDHLKITHSTAQSHPTFLIRHFDLSALQILMYSVVFYNGTLWVSRNDKCLHRKLKKYSVVSTKCYQQSIRFCIHCECSVCLTRTSVQAFSRFGKSSTACASFSLSIKRRADVMMVCFYVYMLCWFWLLPENYQVNYCFGNLCHSWRHQQ